MSIKTQTACVQTNFLSTCEYRMMYDMFMYLCMLGIKHTITLK